tara:strand:- start:43 stop:234 length:192 start_codon:yes stop_codon:yes gene_type:complete
MMNDRQHETYVLAREAIIRAIVKSKDTGYDEPYDVAIAAIVSMEKMGITFRRSNKLKYSYHTK